MAQFMMQNPQAMQDMLNSPIMDAFFSNPELVRTIMMQNPQVQQLCESNPQLAQALNDPETLRQMITALRNPEARRQMMRSADLMMNQLDAMPGGFDALQRAYTQVGEPLLDAMNRSSEPAEVPQPEQYPPPPPSANPSEGALPNPWGSPSSPSAGTGGASSTGAGDANPFGISPEMMNSLLGGMGGMGGAGAGAGAGMNGMMNPDVIMQMMDNPLVQQQLNSFAQNPEMIRALANSPLLANVPGSEIFRQNPEMLARMLQPENMRAMLQLQQAFGMPPGGGMGTTMPASSSSSSTPQQSGAPLFQTVPIAVVPPSSSNPPVDYAQRYAEQLNQLEEMGFPDRQRNLQALIHTQGNVQFAVNRLLG